MSNFLIVYSTGVHYKIMDKIVISNPIALIFGRCVP